jgi:uncharacterized protein YqeY
MSLKDRIINDMTAAMKAQDAARTSTLRMVKAAIMNREKDGGGAITDEDVLKLLRSQGETKARFCRAVSKGRTSGIG